MNPLVVDRVQWNGRVVTLTWDRGLVPDAASVTQVSGVCLTDRGEIVLVAGADQLWGLPGGHPEPGERPEATLRREVWEEACAVIEALAYLGAQRVDDPEESEAHYQLRYWARVRLEPFVPRHETTARRTITPKAFSSTLAWGHSPIATALLRVALDYDLLSAEGP